MPLLLSIINFIILRRYFPFISSCFNKNNALRVTCKLLNINFTLLPFYCFLSIFGITMDKIKANIDIATSITNKACKELFKDSLICSLVIASLYVEDLYKLLGSTPCTPC